MEEAFLHCGAQKRMQGVEQLLPDDLEPASGFSFAS